MKIYMTTKLIQTEPIHNDERIGFYSRYDEMY